MKQDRVIKPGEERSNTTARARVERLAGPERRAQAASHVCGNAKGRDVSASRKVSPLQPKSDGTHSSWNKVAFSVGEIPLVVYVRYTFLGSMEDQALQYYMHDGPTAFRLELAGNLNGEGVRRLAQDWRTASSAIGGRRLIVDMTFVTSADEDGRALIARWNRDGAQLIANSEASRGLAESILNESLPEHAAIAEEPTWFPFRTSFLGLALILLLLATLFENGER